MTIRRALRESVELRTRMLQDEIFLKSAEWAMELLVERLAYRSKFFIAGNGGSAADAQHFAAELVGRYLKDRPPYPALALTTDTSMLTAWSNDVSFNTVFSRQIQAFGQPGDVFVGISTSGNSENIVQAVIEAQNLNMTTICLLGCDGGRLAKLCHRAVIVPSLSTPRIQECHIMLIHAWCEQIEEALTQRSL